MARAISLHAMGALVIAMALPPTGARLISTSIKTIAALAGMCAHPGRPAEVASVVSESTAFESRSQPLREVPRKPVPLIKRSLQVGHLQVASNLFLNGFQIP